MKRKTKKGQAALEFLSTYGWAFLIVIVMIGALAYFGVLKTDMFLPERCLFEAGLNCKEAQAQISGNINAKIINNFGKPIQIINVSADCTGVSVGCQACSAPGWCNLAAPTAIWRLDEEKELTISTNAGGISAADMPKIKIKIVYKYPDDYFDKTVTGELYLKPS